MVMDLISPLYHIVAAVFAIAAFAGCSEEKSGTVATDGEFILDLLMTAKYFERIGDHASKYSGVGIVFHTRTP